MKRFSPSSRSSGSSAKGTSASKDPASRLKELLEGSEPPGFILVTAPDLIRQRRIEARIKAALKIEDSQAVKIRGEDLTPEAVAKLGDSRMTLSLFAGPRLYVIHALDKAPQGSLKAFAALLSQPAQGTTVLCFSSPLAASHLIGQTAEKAGTYLKFPEMNTEELTKWTMKEAATASIEGCPRTVIERLIDLGEQSPDRIAELVSHLALYLDGEPPTLEAVTALFPSSPEAGEFELVDAIAAGAIAKAEQLFATLIRAGKSPFMLLGMIAKIFGNYHSIAMLLDRKVPPPAIREQLKMSPWVFNKSLDAARRIRPRDVEKQLQAIVRADSKLKNRSLGPEAIFSELFDALRPAPRSGIQERHA